ncbi:MAG TPA: ABC transporter ATP-binding protein [Limnochordales bacterium]
MTEQAWLVLEEVVAGYYPEQRVLNGVSLAAARGKVTVVLGPNGSGKSTALRVLYGLVMPVRGRVLLEGRDITRVPVHERVRLGMGFLPQGRSVFPALTVHENLELGAWALPAPERPQALARIYDRYPMLRDWRHKPAGSLSGGQQRTLEIARMMITDPQVILLDEPSAGLAPVVADWVYQEVGRLRDEGRTVLLVDQNVRAAVELADYIYTLEFGRKQLEGGREDFESRLADVVRAWLRV